MRNRNINWFGFSKKHFKSYVHTHTCINPLLPTSLYIHAHFHITSGYLLYPSKSLASDFCPFPSTPPHASGPIGHWYTKPVLASASKFPLKSIPPGKDPRGAPAIILWKEILNLITTEKDKTITTQKMLLF